MPRPETLNALLGDIAKSQTRDIQTCRHCGDVTTLARVTDRCDRCDRPGRCHHQSSITCLPALRENQTHPAKGGFFVSESAKGRAPSLCSLCSLPNRWGRRLTSEPGAPGRLSRGAKREGRKHSTNERSERVPLAPQAPEPQRKLKDSRELKEEIQAKTKRKISTFRTSAATL